MTADKFLDKYNYKGVLTENMDVEDFNRATSNDLIQDVMIDFAKYHVELALITAFEKAELRYECGNKDKSNCLAVFCRNCMETIDEKSIINAYPLTNII